MIFFDALTVLFMLLGVFFITVAGLGILRMPDLYIRMHASTKAGTIGLGLLMVAVSLHFRDLASVSRAVAIMIFLVLTAPVAAHMLGKSMLDKGYKMWHKDGTRR
ncbi:MAG: monovalent cation/H(+) antiporter subunit G [Pseudohongiellaceae bacterium]